LETPILTYYTIQHHNSSLPLLPSPPPPPNNIITPHLTNNSPPHPLIHPFHSLITLIIHISIHKKKRALLHYPPPFQSSMSHYSITTTKPPLSIPYTNFNPPNPSPSSATKKLICTQKKKKAIRRKHDHLAVKAHPSIHPIQFISSINQQLQGIIPPNLPQAKETKKKLFELAPFHFPSSLSLPFHAPPPRFSMPAPNLSSIPPSVRPRHAWVASFRWRSNIILRIREATEFFLHCL